MSSLTTINGLKAVHAVVTDECRINKTAVGAIDEALARLRAVAISTVEYRDGVGNNDDVDYHFELAVDAKREG